MTHSEIRSRAGIPSIEYILLHCQLRWLGHVIRMPDSRLPHCVLYGQLKQGHGSVGGQKKRFRDHIKSIMEALASNRSTCAHRMSYLMLSTVMLQLSDSIAEASMLQRPAHFMILLTNAQFVAGNAEDVVIRNGWTPGGGGGHVALRHGYVPTQCIQK